MVYLDSTPKIAVRRANVVPVPDTSRQSVHVWHDRNRVVRAHSHTVAGRFWMHLAGTASFSFERSGTSAVAFPLKNVSPAEVNDVYRRTIVPMILQVQGFEVLHSSAILTSQGVVAFCGVSETGKSTLAYELSRACNYPLWADDAVVFCSAEDGFQALPLPFTTRLRPSSVRFFGEHPSVCRANPDWSDFAGVLKQTTSLAAVCVLVRDDSMNSEQPVSIHRIAAKTAFTHTLTHANCFSFEDPADKQRTLAQLLSFAGRVPFIEVRFLPGFEHLGRVARTVDQKLCDMF